MALNKEIINNGVTISYWKISSLSISYTGKIAQIYIMGFIDEEMRESGLDKSFTLKNYYCKKDLFDKYFGTEETTYPNPLQASYKYLKENIEDFKDAIDC